MTSLEGISNLNNLQMSPNEVAVKVAVRVRPLNNREKLHQHQPCVRIASDTNQLVIGKDKLFTFDYVLPPKTSQGDVYDTCVKSLVHSLFEGYNATVFAYGQTGSGKTHTISGSKASLDEYGIIPRAVGTIFQIIEQNSSASHRHQQNKEFCVKINFIEIYKEELKDLLDSTDKELQIRDDETGNTIIYGANEVVCTSLEEVIACFDSGTLLRHTGSTLMNEQSSRSHSVFTISIEQRWSDSSSKTVRESAIYDMANNNGPNSYYLGAKFHFVDLAGSERVHRTGNVGDRFKESIHINSGLLALGNVISALSSNDSKKKVVHIPYRESKITRILKDSLGGNANTLMICCISPSSCNLDESINALKYASRARYIKNKPTVNMDPETQRFVEMQTEIQALRDELHRQRTVLSANVNGHQQNFNDEEVKELETNLESAQMEADHYKKLVKEAYGRFKQLNSSLNSNNTAITRKIVDDWLNMFEASKNKADFDIEDFTKQKIIQLETQLKQAQDDLKSDEEIFADKEKEINTLKEAVGDLEQKLSISNRCLEASLSKEKEQQELMLQLQLQLDKLIQNKADFSKQNDLNSFKSNSKTSNLSNNSQQSNLSSKQQQQQQQHQLNQRAKTAPNNQLTVLNQNESASSSNLNDNQLNAQKNRAVYSSPAVFNLERFMQSFRARSQLLTETLEENDSVLQKKLNSTFDVEPDELEEDSYNPSKKVKNNDLNDENEENIDDPRFVRKGTFKVTRPRPSHADTNSKKQIDPKPESAVLESNKKLRDLSINIKMKEELIKELVANSKLTNRFNLQYKQKVELLEKEIAQYKNEIGDLQRQINSVEQFPGPISPKEMSRVEFELKKKLEFAQQRINELELKQKENLKTMNITGNSDKKLSDLELAFGKLKQQNDQLQKKLKEDSDRKLKLEKDFEKDQQRLKELEMRSEKQQQILKKKTEDLAQAQRRLRSGSSSGLAEENNKHWVEQEMEKICQEKRQMEIFKDELMNREELIKKKEILLKEKNDLEIKKLRSSQAQMETSSNNNNKHKHLEETHSSLVKQRKHLDDKLNKGDILSPGEERRLIEIDEAIEALEIAIEFENDSIRDQQIKLRDSHLFDDSNQISDGVLQKLSTVPYDETKYLVKKFFQKIIDLKEIEQKKNLENSELQIQLEEQNRLVEQLKQALNASGTELDRRVVEQKTKAEKNVKLLTHQLNECTSRIALLDREIVSYKEKLVKLKSKTDLQQNDSDNREYFMKNDSPNTNSNGFSIEASNQDLSGSMMKQVKVSRKDLRRLTEEEILKRSLKKEQSNMSDLGSNGHSGYNNF